MRKAILFSILFLINLNINLNAFPQTGITLRGTLKDDKGQPVANTQISVRGDAFSNTKSDGQFAIGLTNQVLPGQTVTLRVSKDRWIINDPVDGKWNVPSARFFAEQTLPVTIVPYGSLALLSPARLNEQLSRIKDELTHKLNEARQRTRSLAARDAENKAEIAALKQQVMTDLLRQWEKDYGLTTAQMEEVISQYARTANPKDDDRTKGLKAFQNGDYNRAADYFEKAALQDEDDIARKEAELELERLSAFNNWKAKGDAHSNLQKYELAIAAYDRAARYVTVERRPLEWASLQLDRGTARAQFGSRTEPLAAQRLLTEAVQAYRQALTVYTREQLPQDWAITQNNLGNALREQAALAEGGEAARLYVEAVQAYRQALTVYTRELLPQYWATTQNNLGIVLHNQAALMEGAEAARLYAEAVQVYRQALTVRTREQLPQQWAMTQSNLADLYFSMQKWEDAVTCYESMLSVNSNYSKYAQQRISNIYHDELFLFTKAFETKTRRLADSPNDLSIQADFAENHFTTARFAEAETRLAALIVNEKLDADTQTALRVIEIANALALGQAKSVKPQLAALIAAVTLQPADFRVGWSFNGTLHFIGTHEPLAARRDWLRQLITALQAENRDAILIALRSAQQQFRER